MGKEAQNQLVRLPILTVILDIVAKCYELILFIFFPDIALEIYELTSDNILRKPASSTTGT